MAVAVAVAVSGGVAVPVAVPVAGLTKRFFNQKDFLINVWGYAITRQPWFPEPSARYDGCLLSNYIYFVPY